MLYRLLGVIILLSVIGAVLVFKVDELERDRKTLVLITPLIVGALMYLLVILLDKVFNSGMDCDGGALFIMGLSLIVFGFGVYINVLNLVYKGIKKFIK